MGDAITPANLPISLFRGPLKFGDVTLDAHVLDNGMRVLSQSTVVAALTGRESGNLRSYLERIPNSTTISGSGTVQDAGPFLAPDSIPFRVPSAANAKGVVGKGVTSDGFVMIVKAYADAFVAGTLHTQQRHIGERCTRIMFALAGVAIAALIDEATGYRERNYALEIERKIATYLLPSPTDWERTFPTEFFTLLHKLFGYQREGSKNHGFVQWFIHEYVYSFLDKDVAREVKARNPTPHFGSNHHQHYADRAKALLNAHIARLMSVMRQSSNKDDFYMRFACEFKGAGLQLMLPTTTPPAKVRPTTP